MCGPPTRVPGSPKLSTFRDMNPSLSRVFSPILRIPPDFTAARKRYAVFPKTPQSAQNPGFAAIRGSGWTVPVGKGEERLTETGYHSSRNSNDLPDAPVSAPGRTISSISLILQPAPHPHLYYITRTRGADSPELPTLPSGSGHLASRNCPRYYPKPATPLWRARPRERPSREEKSGVLFARNLAVGTVGTVSTVLENGRGCRLKGGPSRFSAGEREGTGAKCFGSGREALFGGRKTCYNIL